MKHCHSKFVNAKKTTLDISNGLLLSSIKDHTRTQRNTLHIVGIICNFIVFEWKFVIFYPLKLNVDDLYSIFLKQEIKLKRMNEKKNSHKAILNFDFETKLCENTFVFFFYDPTSSAPNLVRGFIECTIFSMQINRMYIL